MRGQFFKYWNRIRFSFWFLPAVMAGMAVALAIVSVTVDEPMTEWLALNLGWTFTGGAEGASAVLGIVAGSMITIAGVVFSMTLVVLSLASAQLGPRLLRVFMSDSTTQVVLGTFIATFLYCLLVLRTIRRAEEVAFVPHLSVTVGVLLAVASIGVLIYFIHHVSVSIQANEIAARVGKELIERIDHLFPQHIGRGAQGIPTEPPDAAFFKAFDQEARPVGAAGDGYLQFIDGEALLALAVDEDLVVRLERKPGDYVVASCPLALVWPGDRVTNRLTNQVQSLFVLGQQRTSDQDIEFGVNQLVEIAVRALSPGLNDPFTAITCVDHLGSALCRLATRDMPSPYRHDRQNQLRVIAPVNTFPAVMDAAFNQIRQYGRTSAAVTIRLLEMIAVVAGFTHRPEDRATLSRHAEMIARGAAGRRGPPGGGRALPDGTPVVQRTGRAWPLRCTYARALHSAATWVGDWAGRRGGQLGGRRVLTLKLYRRSLSARSRACSAAAAGATLSVGTAGTRAAFSGISVCPCWLSHRQLPLWASFSMLCTMQ